MPLTDIDCAATYKILILGDASVGKSALLRCLIGREFQERLYPTIATDFVRKRFEVDGALVELQVWDTAGQERFRSVTRWQYRGVKGVVMVYDITNKSTFTHLSYWIRSVNEEIAHDHNKYEVVPIVLLGNKCDMQSCRQVQTREGKKLAEKELAFDFLETSAKNGNNVFQAFRMIAYHVTEICNPDVMKSYHPNMIRIPKYTLTDYKEINSLSVVKYSKAKSKVTIESSKPKTKCTSSKCFCITSTCTATVKLKRKSSKRRPKCCKT